MNLENTQSLDKRLLDSQALDSQTLDKQCRNRTIYTAVKKRHKNAAFGLLLVLLLLMLSGCGLISSKSPQAVDSPVPLETQSPEAIQANADVAEITKADTINQSHFADVSLRFLSLEQELAQRGNDQVLQPTKLTKHGYFWLDGVVKAINYSDGTVNIVEVESIYDGERYLVSGSSGILEKLVEGRFVYLNGFYDTFSGFTVLDQFNSKELLEKVVSKSSSPSVVVNSFDYGIVEQFNKRKQTVLLSNGNEISLSGETSVYDAYSKQSLTKNGFWRALSQGDSVYVTAKGDSSTLWLVDKQRSDKAVFGTVKNVNVSKNELVLETDMWLLNDNEPVNQEAEVLLKTDRKSQLISSDGYVLSADTSSLVAGQQVVVEGIQKGRSLMVERLYIKEKKKLPVYVYGTVNKHQENQQKIDLTVEWMFGLDPATSVEVVINSFTEVFEIEDKKATIDKYEFWKLVSLSDDIEVEGYMVGKTIQANRLFLGNKEIELQTLNGTVDSSSSIQDGKIALRLYSFSTETLATDTVLVKPSSTTAARADLVELQLSKDVAIQDIHGAESLIAEEFLSRLEPSDQLTVKGYFENNLFIAKTVEFEDKDTTPFVFGEVEDFDVSTKQIMLKGKNQVIILTRTTDIKNKKLQRLSASNFWSELTIGDSIDIEGRYTDGVFFASDIFLSPQSKELDKNLEQLPDKNDSFNLFDWLMN